MTESAGAFRRDVQGLRALAVLGVVLYHVDRFLAGGFVGVDVFFVISGFVIAGSLLRRSEGSGRVGLGDFYRRRATRILPALIVFIAGSFPIVLLGPAATLESGMRTAAAAVGFVANMQLVAIEDSGYFSAEAELNPYLHLWSLSVEEQFYLAFPLLVMFGLWRGRGGADRALSRILQLATFGSFLLMVATIGVGRLDAAFFLAPTRAWEFLAGALLAVGATRTRRPTTASALRIGGLGAIALTMIAAPSGAWPSLLTVVTVGGTAAVIAAGDTAGIGRRLLTNRAMVTIGALSYSWYLWHWPIVVTVRLAAPGVGWADDLAALASLVPAWLSWHFVEEPFRRRELPSLRVVAVRSTAALAVVACLALLVMPAIGDRLGGNLTDVAEAASVAAIVELDACPSGAPVDDTALARCGRAGDPDTTAVLVGDSFAGQVAEPFAAATVAAGWNPIVRTRTACAFLPGVTLTEAGTPNSACAEHNDAVWTYLRDVRPATVVISNRLQPALVDDGVTLSTQDSPAIAGLDERRDLVLDTYRTMATTMAAQGTRIVFLRGTPETEVFSLAACPRSRWLLDPAACGRSATLAEARERRAADDAVIDTVATEFGLAVVDFDDELCPAGDCRAYRDGEWIYADQGHMTAPFARTLAPLFGVLFAPPGETEGGTPGPGGATPPTTPGAQPTTPPGVPGGTPAPDVSTPGVPRPPSRPQTPRPDVTLPDVTPPDVTLPDVTLPDVTLPDVTIPEVTTPDVTVPNVAVPAINRPGIVGPNPGRPRTTPDDDAARANPGG